MKNLDGGLWPLAWVALFICLAYSCHDNRQHILDKKILEQQSKGVCL